MNKATAWIKDYLYLFSLEMRTLFRRTPPKHYTLNKNADKVPVIFLPGVFERWTFLKPLADHVSKLGHPVYVVPKLGSNNLKDIPSSAKTVSKTIKQNSLKNVVIVAHSKGGLIGKYLMLHEDKDHRVLGLIAVATPFHGSSVGKYFPHYSVKELLGDSEIIKHLEAHKAINRKIISIIPSYDNLVWHKDGSYLEGAKENLEVNIMGHHRILKDRKLWHKIVERINEFGSTLE